MVYFLYQTNVIEPIDFKIDHDFFPRPRISGQNSLRLEVFWSTYYLERSEKLMVFGSTYNLERSERLKGFGPTYYLERSERLKGS